MNGESQENKGSMPPKKILCPLVQGNEKYLVEFTNILSLLGKNWQMTIIH